MPAAAEKSLGHDHRFHSVAGTAENTGIEARCVDLITATQAFHWFDRTAARAEFQRISRPGGWVAVTWNERLRGPDPFHAGYERIVRRWGTDYEKVDHSLIGNAEMSRFFAPAQLESKEFANAQVLDWEGLKNRLLSSSFAPNLRSPDCAPMLVQLEALFRATSESGRVTLQYRTLVYYAQLVPQTSSPM